MRSYGYVLWTILTNNDNVFMIALSYFNNTPLACIPPPMPDPCVHAFISAQLLMLASVRECFLAAKKFFDN